jgi:hypothetical protein
MHVASFVPEFCGAYLTVLIGERFESEFRLALALTKIAADFSNCMRES